MLHAERTKCVTVHNRTFGLCCKKNAVNQLSQVNDRNLIRVMYV